MIRSTLRKIPPETDRMRQGVESFLSERRPAPACSDSRSTAGDGIRRALEELGSVFAAFGLYLSTRRDVLTIDDCRDLSFIDDGAPPMSSWRIRESLTDEVGASACEPLSG